MIKVSATEVAMVTAETVIEKEAGTEAVDVTGGDKVADAVEVTGLDKVAVAEA